MEVDWLKVFLHKFKPLIGPFVQLKQFWHFGLKIRLHILWAPWLLRFTLTIQLGSSSIYKFMRYIIGYNIPHTFIPWKAHYILVIYDGFSLYRNNINKIDPLNQVWFSENCWKWEGQPHLEKLFLKYFTFQSSVVQTIELCRRLPVSVGRGWTRVDYSDAWPCVKEGKCREDQLTQRPQKNKRGQSKDWHGRMLKPGYSWNYLDPLARDGTLIHFHKLSRR